MKRILITGKNGYIGNSFEQWVNQWPDEYKVDKVSLRDNDWENADWSVYDTVFHTAGIAHRKITKENEHEYYEINRDLAIKVTKKANKEHVQQLIFLSTMSVYGISTGVITEDTPLKPKNAYGKSKLEAEESIFSFQSDKFNIAIIRPPMVYGKNSRGNYVRLSKLAKRIPVFPDISNRRSMIYIDNLSELVKELIDKLKSGLYLPQNSEYINTSEMVKMIAEKNDKKIYLTKIFNPIIKILNLNVVNKVFGDLIYEQELSDFKDIEYQIFGFNKTIKLTEMK